MDVGYGPAHISVPVTATPVHLDGGLFIGGLGLAVAVCGPTALRSVQGRALAVMTAWGSGTALIVEWLAAGRGWTWTSQWYNPTLFTVRRDPVTLFPILVWVVSPGVFYVLLVRVVEP